MNRIPITRVNRFFDENDFGLEIDMGREALEGDGNFRVVLYRPDRTMTTMNIYGEARPNEIMYHPPIELYVMPVFNESENITFNKGSGSLRDQQDGKFNFYVYQAHLDELKTNIEYGDYIGYSVSETEMRYFSVVDNDSKNFSNERTIMGYKGFYKYIECAPVDYNEFKGV